MNFATKKRISTVWLLTLASLLSACSTTTVSSYDPLCQIYSEIAPQAMALDIKEGKLADTIESKMPVFFESDYVNIMTADRIKRFALIKSMADGEGQADWQCMTMERYFAGEFD
ncbi:MAG: hypothetical protein L3J89_08170 [Gammaproteobacteria bacterium]|nr:hypothetical protein [Gammaproteobacteria bacterium]